MCCWKSALVCRIRMIYEKLQKKCRFCSLFNCYLPWRKDALKSDGLQGRRAIFWPNSPNPWGVTGDTGKGSSGCVLWCHPAHLGNLKQRKPEWKYTQVSAPSCKNVWIPAGTSALFFVFLQEPNLSVGPTQKWPYLLQYNIDTATIG